MSEFKLPHEKDFRPDSKLCGYLTENAAAIEQEDRRDDKALVDEIEAREKGDNAEKEERQSADSDLEKRIKSLEDNSATHDEVKEAKEFMNSKAEGVVMGTDLSTVRRAVELILKQEGVI